MISVHAFNGVLAILHRDGFVADFLGPVTIIFFWDDELLFWVLCILRFGMH